MYATNDHKSFDCGLEFHNLVNSALLSNGTIFKTEEAIDGSFSVVVKTKSCSTEAPRKMN